MPPDERNEEGAVTIGLDDVYKHLLEVRDEVRAMRPIPACIDDHEPLYWPLERKVWIAAGAAAAAAGACPAGYGQQQLGS